MTADFSIVDLLVARRYFVREVKKLAKKKMMRLAKKEINEMALNLMRRTREADPKAYAKLIIDMRLH